VFGETEVVRCASRVADNCFASSGVKLRYNLLDRRWACAELPHNGRGVQSASQTNQVAGADQATKRLIDCSPRPQVKKLLRRHRGPFRGAANLSHDSFRESAHYASFFVRKINLFLTF
jgi:hypothetical protein